MSETTDETEFLGKQLLNKSRTVGLRSKMGNFVREHGTEHDLKQMRAEAEDDGRDISDMVKEGREERL